MDAENMWEYMGICREYAGRRPKIREGPLSDELSWTMLDNAGQLPAGRRNVNSSPIGSDSAG